MNQEEKRAKFEVVFQNFQHEIYRVALYFTQQEQAAAEITQKAFYNLYLHFENVEPKSMKAYMVRSVRNMTYNWTRDNKIAKEGNIEDYYEDVFVVSLEEVFIREEEKKIAFDLAESILSSLYHKNPRWYEAILQVYYLGVSQDDYARQLGVAKDVISSRLYRAKQWIRENYREQYDEAMES